MATTPAPTPEDYELVKLSKLQRETNPETWPTAQELAAIDRVLVQQARERLSQER